MRDFFINALEKLIAVVVVLLGLGVLAASIGIMFAPAQPGQPSGVLPGLLVLVLGAVYVLFVGGFMYLGLGIYQNTRKTAEAVAKLAERGAV